MQKSRIFAFVPWATLDFTHFSPFEQLYAKCMNQIWFVQWLCKLKTAQTKAIHAKFISYKLKIN